MSWQAFAIPLVSSAIRGKYADGSSAHIEQHLVELSPLIESVASEAELRAHLAAPHSPEQDIANQLIVIALIEKWWSRDGHPGVGIGEIHRTLFGDNAVDALRERDVISDFGGWTLTPWQDVGCRIDEVERAFHELSHGMAGAPLSLQARMLAYVFASIIRIHPFPDGNGRTARMCVQYLLRRWGHSYIVIPKVRNDVEWREALKLATGGDIPALQSQFERRMMHTEGAA